jgi:tRNA threonylcarbamoyladenosine biosynthesis protein TsaE
MLTKTVKSADFSDMVKLISHSADETEQIGEQIAKQLHGTEVIALFGGLGMGKTAFTRGLARVLGVDDGVDTGSTDSTVSIAQKYTDNIYHFDMYRVSSWDDLYSTGFFDYIDNGILVIEWSENIEGALPENAIRITITKGESDNERIFEIEGVEI